MTSKPLSAAAARRLMREEKARIAALAQPAPLLPPQYEAILGSYVPRAVDPVVWDLIRPFVLDCMRRSHVRGEKVFRQLLSELALYLGWVYRDGGTPSLGHAMNHDRIETWIVAKGSDGSDSTWGNRRSRLRNLASHINPGPDAPSRPEPFRRTAIKAPYTRQETADLERLAFNQPTPTMRRQLCAMIGLGLGCGLGSEDLRQLRARDVVRDEAGQLWVEVPGPRPRRVPVRDRYVRFIEAAVVGLKARDLLLGREVTRRNITGPVVGNAAIGSTNVVPDQARLRATWLVSVMTAPVPLADLLAAAGMTTARTIADLLAFCSDPRYVAGLEGER